MTITRTETDGTDEGASAESSGALRELEHRLREQTAQNAELDTEVRYLLEELAITKEFAAALERELESVHAQLGRDTELAAEYQLYRLRLSHRAVDRVVGEVHRLPWLYRPLQMLRRAVSAVASRPHRPTTP